MERPTDESFAQLADKAALVFGFSLQDKHRFTEFMKALADAEIERQKRAEESPVLRPVELHPRRKRRSEQPGAAAREHRGGVRKARTVA